MNPFEGFFETADRDESKIDNENQQGRGSSRQAKVLVAVESIPVEPNSDPKYKHKPNRKVKHLKMTVMDDKLNNEAINFEVQNQVDYKTTALTDGYKGYSKLTKVIANHEVVVVADKTKVDKIFPWVHKTISNAKRLLVGIHHSVNSKYMQNYLDEFCYKFNRRYFGKKLFDRLLIASVSTTWYQNSYKNG